MSDDISHILDDWQFNPDQPIVRIIRGSDGKDKVQMRVDMGILQMEVAGRPDGQRPHGCESLLDWLESQQRAYESSHPDSAPFLLDEDACAQLWREGVQYYHRYLAFWVLKIYELCARDTARSLRLFNFVRDHAPEDQIKMHFEQWRPYVIMMHTRAVATPLVDADRISKALEAIDSGIEQIQEFLDYYDLNERQQPCQELQNLEHWRDEILADKELAADLEPQTRIELLRRQLRGAIELEEFEQAARLRDEIRRLSQHDPP